jgi:hypothetical protein
VEESASFDGIGCGRVDEDAASEGFEGNEFVKWCLNVLISCVNMQLTNKHTWKSSAAKRCRRSGARPPVHSSVSSNAANGRSMTSSALVATGCGSGTIESNLVIASLLFSFSDFLLATQVDDRTLRSPTRLSQVKSWRSVSELDFPPHLIKPFLQLQSSTCSKSFPPFPSLDSTCFHGSWPTFPHTLVPSRRQLLASSLTLIQVQSQSASPQLTRANASLTSKARVGT